MALAFVTAKGIEPSVAGGRAETRDGFRQRSEGGLTGGCVAQPENRAQMPTIAAAHRIEKIFNIDTEYRTNGRLAFGRLPKIGGQLQKAGIGLIFIGFSE